MLEGQLQRLIYVADINLKICDKIQKYIEEKKLLYDRKPETLFLKLIHNNTFFEAVNIMYGLLCSKHKKEISFLDWRKGITSPRHIQELEKIKKDFEDFKFHRMRNNLTSHKSKKIMDPLDSTRLVIREEYILKLSEIIDELNEKTYSWFKPPFAPEERGRLAKDYLDGLNRILEVL